MYQVCIALGAALGLAATGCGSSGIPGCYLRWDRGPAERHEYLGKSEIELWTSPQPPIRGVGCGKYLIKDAQGKPQDSLTVAVLPYMPAMGHGREVLRVLARRTAQLLDASRPFAARSATAASAWKSA